MEKRINNNVILAVDEGKQLVLFGSGIGFQVYPGDLVDKSRIEKTFYPAEDVTYSQMAALITGAGTDELKAVYKILDIAKKKFPEMNDNAFFTLLDHLSFCIKRQKLNMQVINPLEWEVKKFYPMEYQLGKQFLEIIREGMGIVLVESEAAFFALHFVNAQLDRITGNEIFELTEMTNAVVKIVKYHFQCNFQEDSLFYNRFLTHVRYYLMRQLKGESTPFEDESVIMTLRTSCPEEYDCTNKIAQYLMDRNDWHTSETEKMYLILHISNTVKKGKKE
ncbi:MAG: PRD domain-containing protein [Lachnospiraceae bacterium]